MLTVHHLGISQSERIVWLCEELSIPYQLVNYERDPVTPGAPSLVLSNTSKGATEHTRSSSCASSA